MVGDPYDELVLGDMDPDNQTEFVQVKEAVSRQAGCLADSKGCACARNQG